VALDEDRWVGIATALAHAPDQPGPALVGMFVDPAQRGRGVVDALLDAVAGWVREHGGRQLYLWATSTNTPAIRAYTRCGFQPTGDSRPLAHTPSLSEIRMLRELTGPVTALRAGTAADARRIAELQVRAWRAAYRGILPDTHRAGLPVEIRERQWRQWTDGHPLRQIWLVERDGVLVGFAATGPSRDDDASPATGEVYAIYVEPELIGTGLGRRLFTHAVGSLRGQGFTSAMLWMIEGNARARRFYEAAGWRADGGRKVERWGDVEPVEVRYARELS